MFFGRPIDFSPWYYHLSSHFAVISFCLLIIALFLILTRKISNQEINSTYYKSFVRIIFYFQMTICIIIVSIALLALLANLLLNVEVKEYWYSTSIRFPYLIYVISILSSVLSSISWGMLLKFWSKELYFKENFSEKRRGIIVSSIFLANIVFVPVIITGITGGTYHSNYMIIIFLFPLVLIAFILSAILFRSILISKILRWQAICFFFFIVLFMSAGRIVIHFDVFKTTKYLNSLIPLIEDYKKIHGAYPESLHLLSIPDSKIPRMLHIPEGIVKYPLDYIYSYKPEKEEYLFIFHDGLYGEYSYSSKNRIWTAYRLDMWY